MNEHEKRQPEPRVSFGPYRLDMENFQLWRGVQEVRLTGKALAVLRYLVEHAGELATKDELFAAAWPETVVSEATLVSGIQELRQALRDDAKNPRYIETVHRRGYRFIGKVVRSQEVVRSQHPVVSREEQPANEPEVSSVMPAEATSVGMERKLAVIFSTDVAGYSRLMGNDEEATILTLTTYRAVISSLIQRHRGRVVDSPGDNLLAEFASVVDAVRCAVEIQQELKVKNAELLPHRQMQLRIGINVGDVIVEGERLYGDGVNIAARLESLAIPGGICISGTVYDQVETKLALTYEDLGEQSVKNIAKPVRTYRVVMDEAAAALAEQAMLRHAQHERTPTPVTPSPTQPDLSVERRVGFARRKGAMVVGASLLLIAATLLSIRYLSLPTSPQPLAPSPQAALPLPDKPSIVVLPFVNMSKDPDQEYFSDGLTEVLTSDLSRISSLFVISRNSAFTYKGKAIKVQDVSKEMGVRYVLEGSVQKADQQVRINVQLIDATSGYHVWSQQYDRPLHDLFALQDEIVQKIVTTLKLQLTLQEQGYIVHRRTNNLEAYDYVLRGAEYHYRLTQEAVTVQARQLFEKALALDPQYAEAYAWVGFTYWVEWGNRWSADPQTLERVSEMAQKALALDDSLPTAHSLLGIVYAQKHQYDQAIAEGERAIALDPNFADSYGVQAEVLIFAGRPEEALQSVEQAMRLNPRYPPWYLFWVGLAYQMTGRYAEAIATWKEVISRSPNTPGANLLLAVSYVEQWAAQQNPDLQTLAQAEAAVQRALALNAFNPFDHANLGFVYLRQKQYEQAIAEMERAIASNVNLAEMYASLANALGRIGRAAEALAMAEQALRRKPYSADLHLYPVGAAYYFAGRPEEALAPLKQYLARYPNILGAHLTLAAVYSELGQAAEARAEAAEVLRLSPKFSLEVHKQRAPIKDPAMLERHIAALRKAGLR